MKSTASQLPEPLSSKLPAIRDLCTTYQVKFLYVIGSVLSKEFRKESDIDFIYDLDKEAIKMGKYLHNLDGLIAGLIELFPGRELDLVHYPSLRNPYFLEEIDETKVLLYEQDSKEVFV